jgi:ATP-dependent helicase/nuclease subunit A
VPGTWDEIAVDGGRLFFVGDAKQSIYRFRRADIDVFSAVGEKHTSARLQVNFRSVPGVLEAANAAFGDLIGDDPQAGIPYADLEPFRNAPDAIPPVLLLGGPNPGASASVLRKLESEHLADVAVRAKRDEWRISTGTTSYKDMAILLPTRTSLPALERALQDRDVPCRIESRSLIWSTDAVRGLVATLQAIDSPADEVALLAALRNPGLACSDVDLLTWRAAGGQWSIFAGTPSELAADHPVAAALAALRSWHDVRWWVPVNQLVERVVRDLRLVELTASQRRPRDHWRRLRFVVDQSRSWCDSGGSGLGSFVTWAVRQMDDDIDVLETVAPEPDDDAVRILTVHGSKGLEFPITMLANLAVVRGRNQQVLWTDTGPEIRFLGGKLETGGWPAAACAEKEQVRREAIRLLYVAVTRAMDHLVVGCYHSPPTGTNAQRSGAQQLWERLSVNELAATEREVPQPHAPPYPTVPLPPSTLPQRATFAVGRHVLLEAARQRVATSPTAMTVSAAAPETDALDETAVEPDKVTEDVEAVDAVSPRKTVWRRSSRGAAIGTATHRVLELVDLKDPDAQQVCALSRLACAEQRIPELQPDIESRVWSALGSDALQAALTDESRALSEVYLVVPDGDRFLEGYLDLLIDGGPGGLKILDYKTDRATTEAEIAAKRKQYAPQLAAYARAIEQITGQAPSTTDLIFARPGGQPSAHRVRPAR